MVGTAILLIAFLNAAWVVDVGSEESQTVVVCFKTCSCTQQLKISGTLVNCGNQTFSHLPENLPANTTKLNFTNTGIRKVSWEQLATLKKLSHVYLEGNPLLCDCTFYKFWKERVINGTKKVKVYGTCNEPESLQSSSLQDAANSLRTQCQVTSSSVDGSKAYIQPSSSVMSSEAGLGIKDHFMAKTPITTPLPQTSSVVLEKDTVRPTSSFHVAKWKTLMTSSTFMKQNVLSSSTLTKQNVLTSSTITKQNVLTSSIRTKQNVFRTTDQIKVTLRSVTGTFASFSSSVTELVIPQRDMSTRVGLPVISTSIGPPVTTSYTIDQTTVAVRSKVTEKSSTGVPVVMRHVSSSLRVVDTSPSGIPDAVTSTSVPLAARPESGSFQVVGTSPTAVPKAVSSASSLPSSSIYVSSSVVETPPLPRVTSSPVTSSETLTTTVAAPKVSVKTTSSLVTQKSSPVFPEVVVTPSSTAAVPNVSPTTEEPIIGVPKKPLAVASPEDKAVDFGKTTSLICEVEGNPKPVVSFILNGRTVSKGKQGVELEENGNQTKLTLVVKLTSQIECVAENKFGKSRVRSKITVNQKSLSYQLLKLILIGQDWDDSLSDSTSPRYRKLASELEKEVRWELEKVPPFVDAKVIQFSPGSVKADVLIKTENSSIDAMKKAIQEKVKEAHMGRVAVDRYTYSLQRTNACSSEFLNVTWSDATFGAVDVQLCPRQAKGFAKRKCLKSGVWEWPDYTNCHSASFLDVKKKFNMMLAASSSSSELPKNEVAVQNMIISLMRDLLNFTTPNRDHALLAGNIAITTDIIKQLVNFTRVHREGKVAGDEEIQTVLNTASNLLDRYNVQEFIMAQRMIKTASKLIAQLELYGLQAAPVVQLNDENDMAEFVSGNVVMGARRIERPLNITDDVVFPNYNKPKLEGLPRKWNATSFVILRKKTIVTLKTGKHGVLMANFLYKTLTRILSIESSFGPAKDGMAFELNSAVISSSLSPKPEEKFETPIEIASKNLDEVELELDPRPICAFWDFELNNGHGGWSRDGCWLSQYNLMRTACHCNHLTNFAVLREVPLPYVAAARIPVDTYFLCIYIGCWVMLFWAVLTFIVLLICCRNLRPDYTWIMHLMVCATLIVAFALILVGLDVDSYNNPPFCNLLSILVHYFYLCAFSWILAEGVYMHKWSSIDGPKGILWLWYIAIGWLVPGMGCLLAWTFNNKSLAGFESPYSCWMFLTTPLIWVFFAIALILILVSIIVFRLVWRDVTGPLRVPLKSQYWKTRFRVHLRYSIILQVMFLLTWLMGVLLTTYYTRAILCVLFIIFCFITGLLLFLFYCVMDRQVRDSSKSCFCFCRKKKQGKYWVNDEYYDKPAEEEGLVPTEKPDQNEKAVEMNNFYKKEEVEEPLLTLEAQPVVEEPPPPVPEEDHVYAKVDKSKKNRNSSEGSEPRTRVYSGLTRAEVIRMAKKSDASRDEAKQFETPDGSREDLVTDEDSPTIMYTPINQEELDEELKQFRTFFAQRQSKKFSSHSTPIVSNKTTTTTTTTTTRVVKRGAKKEKLEIGPDDVFENGLPIENSIPSSPVEKPGGPSQEPDQFQTSVRQETHIEEIVTTSVVVRADDLAALDVLVASEGDGETRIGDTEEPTSRPEGQDITLSLDDNDLVEMPPELPSRHYNGDVIDEDEVTSTFRDKEENMPDLEILDTADDKESQDLKTVTQTTTVMETTIVVKDTDESIEQDVGSSLMDDVMTYFSDPDKSGKDGDWNRLVKDLQDT